MEGLVMGQGFWQGKRVFITGHTGFKGSWLVLWLESLGARITGYSLTPPTKPSLFELARVGQCISSVVGDVRDSEKLSFALKRASPEIVIHMAAQALVKTSYADPVETYSTNVMGTVNLLEAVRKQRNIRAVLVVTSDKCYQNYERGSGYREEEAMGGTDPYSSSKGCAELVTNAYRESYFRTPAETQIATARSGNVIGGGDWADNRLLPDLIKAAAEGMTPIIRNPSAVRPWQHVIEAINGYLILTARLYSEGDRYSGAWNFGPQESDERPVSWVVEKFLYGMELNCGWRIDKNSNLKESRVLKLDTEKARRVLKWRPLLNLEEAVELVTSWTKQFLAGSDPRLITLNQILSYQEKTEWS